MTPAFPAKQAINLALIALLAWLHFGGGGVLPVAAGLISVLVVEETAERDKLTSAQREVIESAVVREYLRAHCSKDAAGNPDYRIADKDNDMSRDSAKWQAAMKLPRASVPWIYITLGSRGFSGPVDDTTLATLHKWGGAP